MYKSNRVISVLIGAWFRLTNMESLSNYYLPKAVMSKSELDRKKIGRFDSPPGKNHGEQYRSLAIMYVYLDEKKMDIVYTLSTD
jgi:hypothetical protein